MKIVIAAVGVCLAIAPAFAATKCEDVKSDIASKLDAKGVKNYQLDIVATADVKDQKVVGSCEGGAKKITYTRGVQAPAAAASQSGQGEKPSAMPKGK